MGKKYNKKKHISLGEILKNGFSSMSPNYINNRYKNKKEVFDNSEKPSNMYWENGIGLVKHYDFKHKQIFGGSIEVERLYIGDISIKVIGPAALSRKQLKFLESYRPYI